MTTPTSSTAPAAARPAPPVLAVLHLRIAVKELGIATAHLVGSCPAAEPVDVPGAPDLVGLLSFDGRPVPVLDLRTRYGLPAASPGPHSRTLILRVDGQWVGLVADEVFGVIELSAADVYPAPGCDAVDDPGCIAGLCRRVRDGQPRELVLVDLTRLIGHDALARLAAFAPTLHAGAVPT
jgi:purine-binding chemotaxis protein CheW